MSLRKTFKTSKELEVQGVWVEVGINDHNGKPIRIRIARMSQTNKRYTIALNRATRPHQSAINTNTMDPLLARDMLQKVFVEAVLLDWDNLPKSDLTGNDEDKDALPFTAENALALFIEMPDLYDDWEKRAQSAATFREEELEDLAKN